MKINIFVRKAALASLLLTQTIACAWSSSHDVEEGPFANTLPEIQTTVCMELPIQDLGRIAQVSKALNAASNATEVWRKRVLGAETKADVINALSVVSYTSDNSLTIEISGDDVMRFVKKGTFVVDGITYACQLNPDESETYKSKVIPFLKDFTYIATGASFYLFLDSNKDAFLCSGDDDDGQNSIRFSPQEEETSLALLRSPSVNQDLAVDHAARAKWVHDLLLLLDENYTDSWFNHFWGSGEHFDFLMYIAKGMRDFHNADPDTEKKIAEFLSAKYTQFNAEHPGDANAAAYLSYLQRKKLWQDPQ